MIDPLAILTLHPIGHISTPFQSKSEAPHQPNTESGEEGIVTLLPGHNFEQALEDLEGMEKIWLIYWFDRNLNWKPKVLVPRGPRGKRGIFATRSPHRPNPIGLSLVDLVVAKGLTLRVKNIDLLDGTPILDIKPYLPSVEAHPRASAGWITSAEADYGSPQFSVRYSELASIQLELLSEFGVDLKPRIERILSRDPYPHPYKRIEIMGDGFVQAIRGWRVHFQLDEQNVLITDLRTGYSEDSFGASKELSDNVAQRAFRATFGR